MRHHFNGSLIILPIYKKWILFEWEFFEMVRTAKSIKKNYIKLLSNNKVLSKNC